MLANILACTKRSGTIPESTWKIKEYLQIHQSPGELKFCIRHEGCSSCTSYKFKLAGERVTGLVKEVGGAYRERPISQGDLDKMHEMGIITSAARSGALQRFVPAVGLQMQVDRLQGEVDELRGQLHSLQQDFAALLTKATALEQKNVCPRSACRRRAGAQLCRDAIEILLPSTRPLHLATWLASAPNR